MNAYQDTPLYKQADTMLLAVQADLPNLDGPLLPHSAKDRVLKQAVRTVASVAQVLSPPVTEDSTRATTNGYSLRALRNCLKLESMFRSYAILAGNSSRTDFPCYAAIRKLYDMLSR